jgi:hypothetical protein
VTLDDECVEAIYSDDGDRRADPEAVPGRYPGPDGVPDTTPLTLDVDGEMFAVRANGFGGTDYTWLTGPHPGYGFGVGPAVDLSVDEHVANIRDFMAAVDPGTGYISGD